MRPPSTLPLFWDPGRWQMALGQRAAIEGVVSQLRPALALEIGTAYGGSLARIAAHSTEVHSLDLAPRVDESQYPNVTFHRGDSHVLLPRLLAGFAEAGRNVDFALVDGDHTGAGVRQDAEYLLASPAVARTILLFHDTQNDACRAGIEAAGFERHAKVVYVDLDFVPEVKRVPPLRERWGGLGLVVIDEGGTNFRLFDESTFRRDGDSAGAGVALNALAREIAAPLRHVRRAARRAGGRIRPRAR